MDYRVSIYLFGVLLLYILQVTRQVFGVKYDRLKKVSCSNPNVLDILVAQPVKETITDSLLLCALSCGRNTDCNFAVFRQSFNSCKHVYGYEPSALIPSFTDEHQCFVLRKIYQPLCQNGGSYSGKICDCPKAYRGWECKQTNPGFCQTSSWREIQHEDYRRLTTIHLEMRMVARDEENQNTTFVYPVSHFRVFDTGHYVAFAALGFLFEDPESEDFESPLKRSYLFYSDTEQLVRMIQLEMNGVVLKEDFSDFDVRLYVRDSVDASQISFSHASDESVSLLIDGLAEGYRLMAREFTRTGFDNVNGNVYFETVRTSLGYGLDNVYSDLYMYSIKWSLKYEAMSVLRQLTMTGEFLSVSQNTETTNYQLDRCWTKYPTNPGMAGILREIVLAGQEIRLIINGSIATDVVMVTTTTADIVVVVADYLTPFNAVDPLGSHSKIRFSLVSLSETRAECDMQFLGSTVYRVEKAHYDSSLEWVVGSRPWTNVFNVASHGTIVNGSKHDVYSAAMSGRNIRVCVEKTSEESACFGNMALTLTSDEHVMFQTQAMLRPYFDTDGIFSGNLDPDCKRTAWLLSTKGWLRMASYVLGVHSPDDAVVSEAFLTMTWFVQ